MARPLGIVDPGGFTRYRRLAVRWKHTAEIRDRYGYTDFTSEPGHVALFRWLYRQAWADDLGPPVLFRAMHRQDAGGTGPAARRERSDPRCRTVRERATGRFWARLARDASSTLVDGLEGLLVVPAGKRRSGLDRLRRPPFRPNIIGLVQALERLGDVRALGVGVSTCRPAAPTGSRPGPLRRGRMGPPSLPTWPQSTGGATLTAYVHVLGTSARDDVIDIFADVFGDLQ